jgi:hypothetical protein
VAGATEKSDLVVMLKKLSLPGQATGSAQVGLTACKHMHLLNQECCHCHVESSMANIDSLPSDIVTVPPMESSQRAPMRASAPLLFNSLSP